MKIKSLFTMKSISASIAFSSLLVMPLVVAFPKLAQATEPCFYNGTWYPHGYIDGIWTCDCGTWKRLHATSPDTNSIVAQVVSPSFVISPTEGPAGTYVRLSASNVSPGTTIVFTEPRTAGQVTVRANQNGVATATFAAMRNNGQSITYQAEVAPGTANEKNLRATFTIR